MLPFELEFQTKVYFGNNIWQEALYKERNLLQTALMIVTTGRSLHRFGYIERLCEYLKNACGADNIMVFDAISANPKLEEIKAGVEVGVREGITTIIGFGGGSAIDAAKAVAAGIGTKEYTVDQMFFEGKCPGKKTLPVIAIPTTAGTGSELSKGAIISDTYKKIKSGIRGEHICPRIAIVDPIFTYTVPRSVTLETGFDVLAHAIESFISVKATEFSMMLSEAAIKTVGRYLPILSKDLQNQDARSHMSYVSMLMGFNLAMVGTALPHRMQYPIGAHTETSHGAGLLAIYPAWLRYEYNHSQNKLHMIIELLTGQSCSDMETTLNGFEDFLKFLDVRRSLAGLGIRKEQIAQLADEVSGNLSADPAYKDVDTISNIYRLAME